MKDMVTLKHMREQIELVIKAKDKELTSLRNIVKELEHFREYVRKRCPELFSQAELFNFEYTDKEA